MFQVVKRDGEIAEFQMAKITSAIDKAFDAKEKNYSKDMIDLLALRVTADFQNKIQDGKVTVEDIQDSVENVLIQAGYSDVAKAYILYRKQREKIRNMKSTILDCTSLGRSTDTQTDTSDDDDRKAQRKDCRLKCFPKLSARCPLLAKARNATFLGIF